MKIIFFIVLLFISSSLAEDGFIPLVCSFTENSVEADAIAEGWTSNFGPFLQATNCGGTIARLLFDTLSNTISDVPPHTQVKVEFYSICPAFLGPAIELRVDESVEGQVTATENGVNNVIRDCNPFTDLSGEIQAFSQVISHTFSTLQIDIEILNPCDVWDIKISYLPLEQEPEPQECFDHLGTLMDGEGNIPMTSSCEPFIQDGEQRFQFTTMFLEPYVFNDQCLDIEVWFSDSLLPEGDGEIDQWSFDGESQKIIWNLKFKDFQDKYNCEDGEIGSQLFWKCHFSVKLIFDGEVQVEYRAKIQVVVDTIMEDSLMVDVQKNVVEGVCCENQLNVETELKFCTDMNCDSFLESPLSVVRKESFFVQHSIVNPEFQDFYLKFLEVQLGEFIPFIVKQDSSQPGKLILELQSNVAKNGMVLTVISQLHKNYVVPVMGDGKGGQTRFLQQESVLRAEERLNNNEYKVAGYEQISVSYGKNLTSNDLEEENRISSSGQDQDSDLGNEQENGSDSKSTIFMIMLGCSLFLSFGLVFVLVYSYFKSKKNQKQNEQKYKESQKIDTEQEFQQAV